MTFVSHSQPRASSVDYRRQDLLAHAPRALLTGAALIAGFKILAAALAPPRVAQSLVFDLVEILIPLFPLALLRHRAVRDRSALVLLLFDMVFTTLAVAQLALARPDAATIALLLTLKVSGTALLLPWAAGWQAAAAGYTAIAYLIGLHASGVSAGSAVMISPLVGGALSVIGTRIIDAHRHTFYQQQAALAESEDKYRSLTEGTVAGVFVYQAERFRFVNEAFARMLGYARADLIGRSNDVLHRAEDLAVARQAMADVLAGRRRSFDSLVRAYRRDGSELHARASFSRISYDDQPALLGVVIDVTGERQREREAAQLTAEVRASEARYRELFEHSTDLIIETDLEGYFTDANRAALMLAGYTRDDLKRRVHLSQILTSESLGIVLQSRRELFAGVPPRQPYYVVEMIAPDGTRRSIELQTRLITGSGQPVRVQSIGRDVTERFRVEAERQRLLARTQQLVTFQRALTAVSLTLHGPHRLDEVFARIALIGRDLFNVEAAYLWYREGDTLVGRGASGPLADQFMGWRLSLAEPSTLTARAFQERRPIYVNHLAASEWASHPVAKCGAQAWMSIPLLTHDQPLGVLVLVDGTAPERFDEQSIEWGRIFAAQAVLAIENARLRDRERTEARTTSLLLTLAQALHARLGQPDLRRVLAQEAAQMLGCDIAAIIAWQPENGTFRVVYVHGLHDDAWAEIQGIEFAPRVPGLFAAGASQFSHHSAPTPLAAALMERCGVEHVLSLPIRRDQSFLAMLVFAQREGRAFSPDAVRLAEGIALHAAIAFENTRLVDALHAANRLKSDFVATMSHELRSPLNVIIGYADLLRDGQFGRLNPQQAQTLDRVLHHSTQLLELINTTLDLSRLERGEVTLAPAEFSLGELLIELAAEFTPRLGASSPEVHWHPTDGVPPLHTDRGKLKLIVRNLVDNALKFTERGRVEVAASQSDGMVTIRVRDTGRGIAADSLPAIFDMFRQIDASDSRAHGGVGLGLYIVRRLVTMLGGTVAVDSAVGVGSTFAVTVPRIAAARRDQSRRPPQGDAMPQFGLTAAHLRD